MHSSAIEFWIGTVLILGAMLLGGCETGKGSITSGAACEIFKPISASKKDTKQTREQVVGHNAAGADACGWTP